MLTIAIELIEEATSNSFLMFCFCNLIIVMILTGSSKPGSMDSQDSTFFTSVSYKMCTIASDDHDYGNDDDDEEMAVSSVSSTQDESLISDLSVSDEDEERGSSHCCDYDDDDDVEDDNNDGDESKPVEVEEVGGEDDLMKRAEEFISKINNEWRQEKLRALNLLVY